MALLCDHEIETLAEGLEIITPYQYQQLNPASYDVTLGHTILVETPGPWRRLMTRRLRHALPYNERWLVVDISETTERHPYYLDPGDFVLGCTDEVVNLPAWLSAQFVLKSSVARRGLEHSEAGWIDGGFNGRVTLELSNVLRRHRLSIWKGMRVGQLKFFRTTVPRNPYGSTGSSHYQHSWGVRPSWEEQRWK